MLGPNEDDKCDGLINLETEKKGGEQSTQAFNYSHTETNSNT